MSGLHMIKVDNSKGSAIKSGKWKNPGAAFYDALLHSFHCVGDVPIDERQLKEKSENGKWMDWDLLLKEAYLIAPVSQIKNSPYGMTPFCRSGCKYPHHVLRGGKLVLSVPGVKAAYARACQQGDFKGEVKEHLLRHIKELGIDTYDTKEGTMAIGENASATRRIDENFDDINSFLLEKTGINLFDQEPIWESADTQSVPSMPVNRKIVFNTGNDELQNLGYEGSTSIIEESAQWIDSFVHDDSFRESVESNMNDIITKCKTPDELFSWMGCIKYGWVDLSGNIQGTGDEDDEELFYAEYRLQSPDQLVRSKVGVCWDVTELERKWFRAHGYQASVYYIEILEDLSCPTHTFLVYRDNTGNASEGESPVYWFESSWGIYAGIHKYSSLKECLTDISNKHCQAYNDKSHPVLITRIDSVPKAGSTWEEYTEIARKSPVINLDKDQPKDLMKEEYDPPIGYDKLPEHLKNDEIHVWRAKTGIELIHQEPSLEELNRIWINWNEMDDNQKAISDKKSMELFGMTNEQHYKKLLSVYQQPENAVVESGDIFDPENPRWTRRTFTEAEEGSVEDQSIDDDPPSLDDENEEDSKEKEQDDAPPELTDEPIEEPSQDEQPDEASTEDPVPAEDSNPEPEKESMPKQTDKAEANKNGVRRKKLYVAFIEWCKEYNIKNAFGSIFDKDAFKVSYPFVPNEMRYFYRLANPMLCVLAGDLTFFPVAELSKINKNNKKLDEMMIFAGTPTDLRVFNCKDKKVYRGTDENGEIVLHEELGDTFDIYIQNMIKKGDILNGPIEESADFQDLTVTES